MISIREVGAAKGDDTMRSLIAEAASNVAARRSAEIGTPDADAFVVPPPIPKPLYEGPSFIGKRCKECQRRYRSSSEYVTCKLCKQVVCRRKGKGPANCKGLHAAIHHVERQKAIREGRA